MERADPSCRTAGSWNAGPATRPTPRPPGPPTPPRPRTRAAGPPTPPRPRTRAAGPPTPPLPTNARGRPAAAPATDGRGRPQGRRSRILPLGRCRARSQRPRRTPRPRPTGGSPRAQPALVVAASHRPRRRAPRGGRPRGVRVRAVRGQEASPTPTLAPTPTPSANPYTGATEGSGKGVKLGYLSFGELVPFASDCYPFAGDGRRGRAHRVRREAGREERGQLHEDALRGRHRGPHPVPVDAGRPGAGVPPGALSGVPVLAVEFDQPPCARTLVSSDDLRAGQIAGTAVGQWVKEKWSCTYDAYVSFESTAAAVKSQK